VTRRRRRPKKRRTELPLEPYLAYLVFAAMGLGTYRLGQDGRLVLLWVLLLAASLVYVDRRPLALEYALTKMGQGGAIGLILGLPLVILASETLRATAGRLYPLGNGTLLFQGVVLVAAPVEEAFFRGVLQKEHGFWPAAALYGLAGIVFFLPAVAGFPAVLIATAVGMAVLGIVYGYVALRYGLAASMACHAVVNLTLFVLPVALGSLGEGG
jgi:membrane protease YdiL (CAAX protease family)